MDQKESKMEKMDKIWTKNEPKMNQKWTKNGPKMDQKWNTKMD